MFKKVIFTILISLVLAAAAWSFYNYQQTKQKIAALTNPEVQEELNQKELSALINKVAKIILLPDEKPSVARIDDAELLKADQPFFRDAQNGDQVLIYTDRAIVYRESEHKIINIGPVSGTVDDAKVQSEEEITLSEELPGEMITVDIRNGSGIKGAAGALAQRFEDEGVYEIFNVGDANRKDYAQTIIINQTNVDATWIEDKTGVLSTSVLPEGVAGSEADIIIIIGRN